MFTFLLLVILILAIGAWPAWGYGPTWGPAPSIVLVLLLLLLLFGAGPRVYGWHFWW